ncbi:hypothetical protein PENTCL1PPCAC_7661 [Pristionchus entomophagus]|uniref:Uncharacterized protein n=1 Tax=Pristionchus entomophagus TaxID=358040 RepID=A0AAV5SQL7_9BILA|nr:hypothetical protein PENTCL1PPCAC_7661 [Pristionchus entomophagus]
MRSLLLLLPILSVAVSAKAGSIDPSFAEALARLCEQSPSHSLCSRVQILDHIPEDARPMVNKKRRRTPTTTTTEAPVNTTRRSRHGKIIRDEQEEKSREFFRSIADEIAIDFENKKPASVQEFANPRRVSTPLREPSTFARFQREPPVAPPLQATTPSLWDWMNATADEEGYLFEDDQQARNEIFKKRWIKALRARKARRRAAHAVRTDRRESGPLTALSEA